MELDKARFAIDTDCPIFTHNIQDAVFDIENKKVFVNGGEYAKIIWFEFSERPDWVIITARVSILSENKFLNGKECLMEGHITWEHLENIKL